MKGRILIIEDEPDVATYLATILRANGYQPQVVTDPNQACAMIKQFKPDLISLDIMMPEKSGLSMYSRLRQEPGYRDIPVLIVSGMTEESQFDFHSLVPDDSIPEPESYFEKPLDVDRYLQVISHLLAKPHKAERK
ncbi:MAG: response regulator [bacterium]